MFTRFLILIGVSLSVFTASAETKPNVLFIAIDDLRPELACYGSDIAITPNLDKLAQRSLLFERAYCNVAVCGASRASLFSGLYPVGNERFLEYDAKIDEDAPGAVTLPQVFKAAGYTTLSNGKIYHAGRDAQDRSWSAPTWRPKGSAGAAMLPETDAIRSDFGRQRGHIVEASDFPDADYYDGKTATKTIEDLRRLHAAGEPFFLACGFSKPHLPFYAPQQYWDLYDADQIPLADNRHKPSNAPREIGGSGEWRTYYTGDMAYNSDEWHRTMRHGYLACVSFVDALVGQVLGELEALGLADNTIVVVWGDHGFHLGEHDFWGKHNTLDNATRVPLIIHVPQAVLAHQAEGKKTAALVESIDLYPTLCELAGLDPPQAVQGRSIAPLLQTPDAAFRSSVFVRFRAAHTVITERYAYTRFETEFGGRMLFDHENDPEENENLVDHPDYRAQAERMETLLQQRIDEAAGG